MLFILGASALVQAAQNGPDVETELKSLLDKFLAGASVSDVEMHERFWDQDLVYTSSDGTRFGKAELMQSLQESVPDEDAADTRYWAEEVALRELGDTVIVTFRLKSSTGAMEKADYLNTGVFIKRDGQWRATAWHATHASTEP